MGSPSWKRRVDNLIWAGARSYRFRPLFHMKDLSGEMDPYMNLIEGLAAKYYGDFAIEDLFSSWAHQVRQYRFDQLTWLCLERAVYEKEKPIRPALSRLQKDYARMLLRPEDEMRRRIFYLKDPLSTRLLLARAHEILDEPYSLGSRERKVYDKLILPLEAGAEEIKARLLSLFQDLGLRPDRTFTPHPFFEKLASLTPRQLEYSNRPDSFNRGEGEKESSSPMVRFLLSRKRARENELTRLFGPSLLSEKDRLLWEEKVCQGAHQGLHLWLSKGAEEKDLSQEFLLERRRNREAYQDRQILYNRAIESLSAQIASVLQAQTGTETSVGRHGRLLGKRAWRASLGSSRIFERTITEPIAGFSVDLLLDGSASRGPDQEEIAAQAIIVSQAMDRVGIANRVLSFCTFQDTTAFTLLKNFDQFSAEALFSYVARGWNRDGLAYRALADLLRQRPSDRHLLLIFTDVTPRDLRPMSGFPHYEYVGKRAQEDALEAMKALRREKIAIAGLISGILSDSDQARLFFGSHFARILRPEELAAGAGRLLQNEIERLTYD